MNTTPRSSLQAAASTDPSSSSNNNNHNHSAAFSTASSKKKLGQNLSKLTKPPAPPVPTGAKSNSSSRNGLLLLSTKRSSSLTSNNVSSAATSTGGGILSGKSSTTSSVAASTATAAPSKTSTNDALFQAAMGRAEAHQLQQLQPDAWGVTEKQQPRNNLNPSLTDQQNSDNVPEVKQPEPTLAPQGGVSSSFMQQHVSPLQRATYTEVHVGSSSRFDSEGRQFAGINGHRYSDEFNRGRPVYDVVDSSRGSQEKYLAQNNNIAITKEHPTDDQSAYMAQLAKERAEARRAEEEARLNEQKERAGQRLRELEEKMAKNAEKPPVVLETLGGGSVGSGTGRTQQQSWQAPDRNHQRTLFDPNSVSYSALLGGPGQRENGEKLPSDQDVRHGSSVSPPMRKPEPGPENGLNHIQYSGPVIHLSSYEDRDRGERGTTVGPRMLFDPKSGAMVAVPTREDTSRGRKERIKRIRNDRDPAVAVLKKIDASPDADYDSTNDRNPRRSSRNRKEDSWNQKGKAQSASTEHVAKSDTKKKHGSTRRNKERSLPRTCGVLYTKDEKGNCYPVDGCDGDLGYGAYSVPGGPTRNPEAYAKFMEKHQSYHHEEPDDVLDDYLCDADNYNSQHEDATATRSVALQTGFKIAEPSPIPKIDWVKPNEKIELLTGIDDSPTLQATAREWAPSQAALVAAAAVAATGPTTAKETKPLASPVPAPMTSVVVQDVQEEDDSPSFIGLGFDPTETMDSVIQSPSIRAQKTGGFDVDLAALSLEPPMSATNRNIFAFGSSATWGDTGDSGNTGWGDLGLGSLNNGFVSRRFSKEGKELPASFLTLTDKAWGGTGVIGLGGAALSGKPAETSGE